MVHWVYVLECVEDYIYVGETKRLYKRFTEHLTNRGGKNTIRHKPHRLIGLYKVDDNHSFINYRTAVKAGEYNPFIIDDWENDGDNLLVENHITERFLYERRGNDVVGGGFEWYKVKGGKYTKETPTINPVNSMLVDTIVDRPLCKCHSPSEVRLSQDKYKIFFVCALKNVWGDFFSDLQINSPCDFWQLFTEDTEVKNNYEISKRRSREKWVLNVPLSMYKIHPELCIICSRSEYLPIFNGGPRRLCQPCIVNKYAEIKAEYSKSRCLIIDDE
jgi:predicted GIY-YIG superfamily endonuclease